MMEALESSVLAGKDILVGLWFVGLFLAERLRPAAREGLAYPGTDEAGAAGPGSPAPRPRGAWRRVGRNLGLWGINLLLSPLAVLPLTLWASSHALGWRPSWWSGPAGLAADLILLDFLIYWWHRANHEIPFLWRFHEVHHLDRFLDSSTALRFHFGEVLLSAAARAGVIVLLGIPFFSVVVFETLVLLGALFHHSNLRIGPGFEAWLSRLIITPAIHWVHHHAVRQDTDSNYGTIFSFWDRLFGSASGTRRWPRMPIGVEGGLERGLLGLVLRPFTINRRGGVERKVL